MIKSETSEPLDRSMQSIQKRPQMKVKTNPLRVQWRPPLFRKRPNNNNNLLHPFGIHNGHAGNPVGPVKINEVKGVDVNSIQNVRRHF